MSDFSEASLISFFYFLNYPFYFLRVRQHGATQARTSSTDFYYYFSQTGTPVVSAEQRQKDTVGRAFLTSRALAGCVFGMPNDFPAEP